jgi:hypothetical protein
MQMFFDFYVFYVCRALSRFPAKIYTFFVSVVHFPEDACKYCETPSFIREAVWI